MVESRRGPDDKNSTDRRKLLKMIGGGGVAFTTGLAGCTGQNGGGDGNGSDGGGDGNGSDGGSDGNGSDGGSGTQASQGGKEVGDGSGKTFNIGAAWPYSGDLAVFGPRNERGMKLAFKHINEAGVNGGKMSASIQETQSSQSAGVTAAQKLINQEGVPVLLGCTSSGVSVAVAKSVAIPNKTLQVIPNSTSPEITQLEDEKYVCRTAVSDALQGRALAKVATNNDIKSAAIVMVNNDYGTGFANAMQKAFEAAGGTITNKAPYESGKASYKPQLNKAISGDPEALVFISYPQSFTTIAKQAYEMGLKDQFQYLGGESIVSNAVEKNVPAKAINGMVGTNPSPPIQSNRYKSFQTDFKNAYDKSPTVWAAYTYDATMLISLALQKAGAFKSKPMRDAIYQVSRPKGKEVTDFKAAKQVLKAGNEINYQGVSGSVNLNKDGDVSGTYQHWKVGNGKFDMKGFIKVEA